MGLAAMLFLDSIMNDLCAEISWLALCIGVMGAWISWLQYQYRKRLLYCVGPHGLIFQHPGSPTLIARWVDVSEFGLELNRLKIELWDRTKYMVVCPKAGRKESARLIKVHLAPEKYAKADQLIRQWEIGIKIKRNQL